MKSWTVAFSRPTELMVCADEEYVHGIQLTIKPHLADDSYEIGSSPNYTSQKIIEMDFEMDQYYLSSDPIKMNLVGTLTPPCQTLKIES